MDRIGWPNAKFKACGGIAGIVRKFNLNVRSSASQFGTDPKTALLAAMWEKIRDERYCRERIGRVQIRRVASASLTPHFTQFQKWGKGVWVSAANAVSTKQTLSWNQI
jgi:hypothetical protein